VSEPLRAPVPLEAPTPGHPRRTRRTPRKSERTRRSILSAAKTLFDRRGYRDTTIDDITRKAGIAHGTFYLYFRDKSQVLEQLLAQTLEEFALIAAREPTRASEISDLIRQSLETYERNRLLMRLLREASAGDAYFREHYEEHFLGALVDHLTLSITHIQASLPADVDRVDPRAAARAIVGMVESFAYGMFIGGEDYSIDLAVETLSRFCSRAVGLPT
jgi:AcrR family transcriptional regulator